jgi:hypothetical protein
MTSSASNVPDDPGRQRLLLDYEEPIRLWVREYAPSLPVLLTVRDWLRSREENPFAGIRYVHGFDNYLFGVIPGTMGDDGRVVTCTYWVFREDWTVRIDMLSTASWPV